MNANFDFFMKIKNIRYINNILNFASFIIMLQLLKYTIISNINTYYQKKNYLNLRA